MLKGSMVAEAFYPFVENGGEATQGADTLVVRHPARIAVFDDLSAAPRVVVIEPSDVRSYLEEITNTVTRLAKEQGGRIPFAVIREVVENLIHAYFMEPAVSILDGGNTIRFSDQGPGIADKVRALEFGTTSATVEMKRYIRGVGSGLPYAQQWLEDKGGSLTVEDNIHNGTVVTVSLAAQHDDPMAQQAPQMPVPGVQQGIYQQQYGYQQPGGYPTAPMGQMPQGYGQPYQQQGAWPQQPQAGWQQPAMNPQSGWPQQGYPMQPTASWPQQAPAQPMWPQGGYQQPWPQQAQAPQQGFGAAPYPATAPDATPEISDRGRIVLDYLRTHESVGPRDLVAISPLSESTWSRTLTQLKDQGLLSKQGGQKYHLTQTGHQLLGV